MERVTELKQFRDAEWFLKCGETQLCEQNVRQSITVIIVAIKQVWVI